LSPPTDISGKFDKSGGTLTGNLGINGNLTVGSGTSSDIYMTDTDNGTRRIHCNSNYIGFLDNTSNWGSYCTDDGGWITRGSLTVNANKSASSIYMYDSDNGNREIHCNSNRVGFLNQAGSWGSWCDDDGSWVTNGNLSTSGLFNLGGNLIGNASNTTELGSYSGGGIKRIRMTQGGELHFGDTTTTNFLGLTEGTVNNFGDQDRLGLYFRNELKMYSNSNTLRFTMDGNGQTIFAGPMNINAGNASASNDASLYVTKTNNNDWTGKFVTQNAGSTEYGVRIQIPTAANYALLIDDNGAQKLQIKGSGEIYTTGNLQWHAGNDGSGSGLDADLLDGNQASNFVTRNTAGSITVNQGAIHFQESNSNQGDHSYAIFQESGAWAHPYPDLRIAYHTGIKIGAHRNYQGTRFYNNSDMVTELMSVGDDSDNVSIKYNLIVNGSTKVGGDTRTAGVAGAGTIRWNSADELLQYSDGSEWGDISEGAPDGSSCDKAATDGYQLKQDHPNLPSGNYSIKPGGTSACITMYVNMDSAKDGGGWDFYACGGCSAHSYATNSNSCPAGTDLVMSRSKGHWEAMLAYKDTGWYLNTGSVYKTSGGGNYTGCYMRSSHYGSGCSGWQVKDGGRWWLRDSTHSEPNGDYSGNGWLRIYGGTSPNSLGFNDGGAYSTDGNYVCSTNAKP